MAREAFIRVRWFLRFKPTAKRAALITSCANGLLYTCLIALLGLFADLVIEGGKILPRAEAQELELERWLSHDVLGSKEAAAQLLERRTEGVGLVSLAWRLHEEAWFLHLHEDWNWRYRLSADLAALPVQWFAWTRGNATFLFGLLTLGVFLAALRWLFTWIMHTSAASAVIEATTRLRRSVYHHTHRIGALLLRDLGPSEAVGVFTRHLEAVHEGLYAWLTTSVREPVQIGSLLLLALIVDPWLSLAFLLFATLVWLVGGRLSAYYRARDRVNSQNAAEQMTLLHESLMMMRLVKAYLMELFNQKRVERQLGDYAESMQLRNRSEAVYQPTLIFLTILTVAVLFGGAGLAILQGGLSVAAVLTISAALLSLYWPVHTWLDYLKIMARARQSAGVLYVFLDRRGEVGQAVDAEFLPPLTRHLEFREVTLRDPTTDQMILENVSVKIRAGERVALMSQNDREKHSFTYLIPRFLDPSEGEIRIDGHRLRWVTLDSLRAQIGLILERSLVFNDTVLNNIGCGDANYSTAQVIEAAKSAHAHQFIQRLPGGYKTKIGELGHSLSVGERYRIALARAILREPALMIIEEPTGGLDDETKSMVDDTFSHFLSGRTTIFLPHRMSTIRSCDRILVLHNGKLEADGDHRDLLNESEFYRHLQYMEFNVFAETGS